MTIDAAPKAVTTGTTIMATVRVGLVDGAELMNPNIASIKVHKIPTINASIIVVAMSINEILFLNFIMALII